jgi:hypothetical protein
MNRTPVLPALLFLAMGSRIRAAAAFPRLWAICLAALSLACSDCLAGHADKRSVRFEAQIGDKASIMIRRSKAPLGAGNDLTMVAAYATEVTGKSAQGYRILWTPRSVKFEGAPDNLATQVNDLVATAMIPIEFDADRAGMPVKIADRDRALRMATEALTKIANVDPKILAQVTSMFKSMDERTLAAIFAKEAALLAKWQRVDLVVGELNLFEATTANPFGGGAQKETVKADVTMAAPTVIRIDWRSEMDTADMLRDMIGFLKKLAVQAGRPPSEPEAQLAGAQLTFEQSGVAEVDLSDGWTRATSLKRLVRIAAPGRAQNRDEFVDIKLTRDPKGGRP